MKRNSPIKYGKELLLSSIKHKYKKLKKKQLKTNKLPNYRLITLINTEYKIHVFTKTLAERLQMAINTIINEDKLA